MHGMAQSPRDTVLQELENRSRAPIDLLELNDGEGESLYILRQRHSYIRTVTDVVSCFANQDPCKIRILEIGAYLGIVSVSLKKIGFDVAHSAQGILLQSPPASTFS